MGFPWYLFVCPSRRRCFALEAAPACKRGAWASRPTKQGPQCDQTSPECTSVGAISLFNGSRRVRLLDSLKYVQTQICMFARPSRQPAGILGKHKSCRRRCNAVPPTEIIRPLHSLHECGPQATKNNLNGRYFSRT